MILLFAGLIIAAVFSTKISSRFGVPLLIVFLGIGMLVGSDALGLIYFDDAALTRRVADILLIFIIFEGGFQTKRSSFQAVRGPALSLATLGVLATALILGFLIHWLTSFDLPRSLMIGSIISSTDAAAVLMITRQNPIRSRVSTTLEVESAANDPMAILLTVAFIEAVVGETSDAVRFVADLLWKFGGGVVVGVVASRIARFLFDKLESENRGYYYVLGIGIPLFCYGAADAIGANGIIAVFFGAYRLGNREFAFKRGVNHFLEGVSALCNVALFLMLGLLVFPSRFAGIWQEGVLIALLVIFAARPIAFLLFTLPFKFEWKERLFMIWGGIKGAVPIVLATYPAAYGIDPEGRVFNIVFFAVLLTCLLQGATLGPLARLLKLTVPTRPRSPYSMELHATRRSDLDIFEIEIDSNSASAGKLIRDLGLPQGALISSIVRGQALISPKGHTELRAGDLLSVLAPVDEIDAATELLVGKAAGRA
jgi:cell volume regulation protein A